MKQIIQWLIFLIPIASLVLIGDKTLRRFLPVTLFVTVVNTLIYQAAYHYNWWREPGLFDWEKVANIPWVYSAYLVATIWIFKFTYGKFIVYLITNLILDGVYIYIFMVSNTRKNGISNRRNVTTYYIFNDDWSSPFNICFSDLV
ncbi:hypothetical protein Amet_1429 [Alkaliphilus metalliredigens QYMF]|uniref:Uncharacterized protein n=1 Tax=Alkaliphilus metalliredigens (strain QYMF) TaxID=293826 RepID=A6TN60_ALKMQ|nr:hypothetical protein [Alkaliphilus metalliredigens]ABR47628.1 hypothetical protein Amet_1429 [Alkaliphilus metalliredigens QYMF]